MAVGDYELAVARLQQYFRARELAVILGPRVSSAAPDERLLLLHLLRGLQESDERGAALPAPTRTWIEEAGAPFDLHHALSLVAEAFAVRHQVAGLRSLWQQVFAEAGLSPTRLHIAAARLAFLGLGQLATLAWDGQLAAACGRIFGRADDVGRCREFVGSVAQPERLVITASEVRHAFGPDGAQATALHDLFARHHVLLIGAEPTHARLLGASPGPRGASCLAFRHPRLHVHAWQGLGWVPIAPRSEDPASAEEVAIGLLEATYGGKIPDPRVVPAIVTAAPGVVVREELSQAQVVELGRRIASIAASVQLRVEQLLRHIGLEPAIWGGKSWEELCAAVHAGASPTLGHGGDALAVLVRHVHERAPGNAWLRQVGEVLASGRSLRSLLERTWPN